MEKSFGLHFHLKKNNYCKGEVPVYMRITVNGEFREISIKRKCDPLKWNVEAGRIDGKTEFAKSFNSYLEVLQRKVYDARKTLLQNDDEVTAENIKILLIGKEINRSKYMLMEIFKRHNDQMAELVGREYAPGTHERYTTSYKHTTSFLEWKYKVTDLDITRLNFEFITEYEFWLKSVRKCDHNSTIKYLSNFRKIVNICIRNGWLQRDPFIGFKMTKREVERTALTELELQALAAKKFSIERLTHILYSKTSARFSCFRPSCLLMASFSS